MVGNPNDGDVNSHRHKDPFLRRCLFNKYELRLVTNIALEMTDKRNESRVFEMVTVCQYLSSFNQPIMNLSELKKAHQVIGIGNFN